MSKRIISAAIAAVIAALSILFGATGAWRSDAASDAVRGTAGDTLQLDRGRFLRGYVTGDNGRQYYFDDRGVMQKDGIVGCEEDGYTFADENGVCCISEEIRLAAAFMVQYCTGDTLDERMKTGFDYLSRHFPYVRSYDHPKKGEELGALAVDMFLNQKGNCYRYAACFACMAKIAGHRVRLVLGTTAGNPHGWVEVKVGSRWYLCDPDAQLPSNNLPDYFAYMMEEHCWQITPMVRFELTITEDGVAVWA